MGNTWTDGIRKWWDITPHHDDYGMKLNSM